MSEVTDEKILQYLRQPQSMDAGFSLLMDKYQERLYRHIRQMVMDHEDANDVLQNCLIKVFRSVHQFRGNAQLYTWLYRIATNEAITFLGRKKRKATHSIDDQELFLERSLTADPYFDGDETQKRLQVALQCLPEKQRAVFHLRYFEEMSYREMSEVLATSEGALKASYHHAVKKIETYFKTIEI